MEVNCTRPVIQDDRGIIPSHDTPVTDGFVSSYMERGFSWALAKQIFHLIRPEGSEHYTISQSVRRVACLPILLSFLPLSIVETTIRVALGILLFIPSFIPCCRNFYNREFAKLTITSLSNCFMFVIFPFLQLAMSTQDINNRARQPITPVVPGEQRSASGASGSIVATP